VHSVKQIWSHAETQSRRETPAFLCGSASLRETFFSFMNAQSISDGVNGVRGNLLR